MLVYPRDEHSLLVGWLTTQQHAGVSQVRTQFVCWLLACLTSQQHASVSQGRICSDNFTCYHTEIEVADPDFPSHPVTVYRHRANQSQHLDFNATGMTRPDPGQISEQERFEPEIFRSRGGDLNHKANEAVGRDRSRRHGENRTTRPT